MFNELLKRVEGAKKSLSPINQLHEVYGQIKMAYELKAITGEEFFKLNTEAVRNGINNPKYFD